LSGHVTDPEDRELLAGDVDTFIANLDVVCEALGSVLEGIAERLCQIVDPLGKCTAPISVVFSLHGFPSWLYLHFSIVLPCHSFPSVLV
jgi:hypothetical protein